MTQKSPQDGFADVTVSTVVALWLLVGAALAMSSLFDLRWWMAGLVALIAGGLILALTSLSPEAALVALLAYGGLALHGFVSVLGGRSAFLIILAAAAVTSLLITAHRLDTSFLRRPVSRSAPKQPVEETTSDQTLLQYAREHLLAGGARSVEAVIDAIAERMSRQRLTLGPEQDLGRIAERALATPTTPPPPTTPRRHPATPRTDPEPDSRPAPEQDPPAPQGRPRSRSVEPPRAVDRPRAESATSRRRPDSRSQLHEFGSFEIERLVAARLEAEPDTDDPDLVDHVLSALGVVDRSPFAMSRLADAIGRVRGVTRPSSAQRKAEERVARLAALPERRPGGRTMLYEYGAHEIERAVEEVLAVHPGSSRAHIVTGVLHILGIDDRSPLARERIDDAILKVTRPRSAVGPARKSAIAKKPAKKKATAKTPVKKKSIKKTAATEKPAEKPVTKRSAPVDAAPQDTREPRTQDTERSDDAGAPGVKDIADLLGF